MSRRAHAPTEASRKQVESLAACGVAQEHVAKIVGISKPTLAKHYAAELELGGVKMLALVAQSLFKKALGDGREATTAAIFIMKTRGGWKETVVNEHGGKDGEPIQMAVTDLSRLPVDRLADLKTILEEAGQEAP